VTVIVGRRGFDRWSVLAVAAVASPLLLWTLTTQLGRPALLALSDALGTPQAYLARGAPASSPTSASDTGSWFGPLGLLLVAGVAVTAVLLVRRRLLDRTALVAAFAPLAWTLIVALTLTYHPWQGRFFLFPVALSASLWGIVLRRSALAWSAVALTGTTALLTLTHYVEKPSGLRLLEPSAVTSVWKLDRSEVQSQHDPALEPLFRFVDERVPRDRFDRARSRHERLRLPSVRATAGACGGARPLRFTRDRRRHRVAPREPGTCPRDR
jgi:hypothetical protein